MPRKKKEIKEEEILLSEQEVRDVFFSFEKFSRALNSYNPTLNPALLNQRMQDLTMNPVVADQTKLDEALRNPKASEEVLQGISEGFEISSQPYKRLLSYLSSMLSWDLTMTCTNADKDDYGTLAYKKDQKIIEGWLDNFDYQKEFAIAVKEMLRNEAFFCSPRFDAERVVLQEMPASPTYTKITGRFGYGLLWSINLYIFLLPGMDLNMFPPFFGKAFNKLWGDNKGNLPTYIPSLAPEMRGNSSWIYWQDVPVDVGWVFKMSPELATRIPAFTALFSELILQPLMRNLQKNVNMAVATRILKGEVPFLNNTSSKVTDSLAISSDSLARFLQLVSSSLTSAVKVAAAPLNNMGAVSFPSDNDLYPTYLRNMLASSGVNTSLIFTGEARANQLESQLSLNTDEQLMMGVYPQFNAFLNYKLNKYTKKFKWDFAFEGTSFFTNRAERLERQTTLMMNGIVLPQKLAAAIGMKPQNFRRQMEEAKANNWVQGLTPILQAAQMTGDAAGGRPSMKANKLGDAGASSQESGDNKLSSAKVKKPTK